MAYDYIIVGGGPAGCVLANRLSADPSIKVLLLEAGGSDWNPLFRMPAGFAKMTKGVASWGWSTVPQTHLNGRVVWYTQAKVIGGGSTINAHSIRAATPRTTTPGRAKRGPRAGAIVRSCRILGAAKTIRASQRLPRLWRAARRLLPDKSSADQLSPFSAPRRRLEFPSMTISMARCRRDRPLPAFRPATPSDRLRRAPSSSR